jgi:hypothetical protein
MTSSVPNPRLDADQVRMGIADWPDSATPEGKDEVKLLLALPYLSDGISVEGLVGMVIDIELEEGLAPIVIPIGNLPVLVLQHRDMLGADQVRVSMTVVQYLMPSVSHHFAEFNNLLRVSTGVEFLACYGVR